MRCWLPNTLTSQVKYNTCDIAYSSCWSAVQEKQQKHRLIKHRQNHTCKYIPLHLVMVKEGGEVRAASF